jgi:hypothetical protein
LFGHAQKLSGMLAQARIGQAFLIRFAHKKS